MAGKWRSSETKDGRRMAGARSLWRANGMKESQFGKPVFGIANSFTQFVPGHTHLHHIGQEVKQIIEEAGYFAAEFNTIAIDDGIAMGHFGMKYSLASRELICDQIESIIVAHPCDGWIGIGNCDKIVPAMYNAMVRLNLPAVYVSGGPMLASREGGDLISVFEGVGQHDRATGEDDLLARAGLI